MKSIARNLRVRAVAPAVLSLACLIGGASLAFAVDVKLSNGSTWKGDAGARVRVTYTLNGKELVAEGVVLKADKSFLRLEVEADGKKSPIMITSFDLRKIETLSSSSDAKGTSGSSGGSSSAPAGGAKSRTASATSTGASAPANAAASTGKQTIFILPWGRGPGGDVDMVGIGARHDEIEKIGAAADKLGEGQIIILLINSGGGLVIEGDKIDVTLRELRKRHRVIAWIEEAISAAAFTALHCDEIYFKSVGSLGAITMFAGTKAIEGSELQAWLKKVGDVCEETNRKRWIGEAMVTNEPELSYDKDEEGNVTWYPTLEGAYKLSDKVENLSITASQAEHSKFSLGTANTEAELFALLKLSPDKIEVSPAGLKIHNDWQSTIKQCKKEKETLIRDFENPTPTDPIDRLNVQLRAAKEIRKWFDKCLPVMAYEAPQLGTPEYWDDMIKRLQNDLRRAKERTN